MTDWDKKERRDVDRDWIERDRLLTEIANDTKHIKETVGKQSASFDIHVLNDSVEFKSIKKRIFYLTMAVFALSIVIGGPSLAIMFIK